MDSIDPNGVVLVGEARANAIYSVTDKGAVAAVATKAVDTKISTIHAGAPPRLAEPPA